MKKAFSIAMLCLLVFSGLEASVVSITNEGIAQEYSYTFELSPYIQYETIDTSNGLYANFSISQEGYTTTVGEARLPVLNRLVQIPYGSDPFVTVISAEWEETSLQDLHLPHMIIPLQPSIFKDEEPINNVFMMDTEYYTTNAFLQTTPARIIETGIIRGHRFALLQISPLQYNPVTGQVRILTNLKVKLTVDYTDMLTTSKNIERYTTPAFENNLKETFVNYQDFHPQITSSMVANLILIIVHDEFANDITRLKTWKESIGYTVVVTKTSEIPGGITTTNLKNYIQGAYDNWQFHQDLYY